MKRTTEYLANDGTRFATAEECKKHEVEAGRERLIGLTKENLAAAFARTDVELANAIEAVGHLIAEKRRADGGLRRKRKTVAEGSTIIATTQAKKANK